MDARQGARDGCGCDGVWTQRQGARDSGANMGAWTSDDAKHGSALVAARLGRTGECAAEEVGRAAAGEIEMAEAEPDRLHGPAIGGLVSRVVTQVVLCM